MAYRSATVSAILCAAACTSWAQNHLAESRQTSPSFLVGLHPKVLGALSFGQAQTLADVLYLQAVALWGQRSPAGSRYADLAPLLQHTLALDPYHEAAYLLAGTALTTQGMQQDEGMALLRRGAHLFPNNWRLLFLYGFNALDLQGDRATAARVLAQAALLPGSPPQLPMLAASLSAQSNTFATAIVMLETLAQETDDADEARRYRQRIADLRRQAQETHEP